MPRNKQTILGDAVAEGAPSRRWDQTHGQYISGRAWLDEADKTAAAMEAKWGAGRLRLLVGPELREKFDRQRYLLNQAIWHGELEDVRREAGRMVNGWAALDRMADASGAAKLSADVWEVALPDGSVAAIVPSFDHAAAVVGEGRLVNVYTLEEVARLLAAFPAIAKAKVTWPGARVEAINRSVADPLDSIAGTSEPLDDEIGF